MSSPTRSLAGLVERFPGLRKLGAAASRASIPFVQQLTDTECGVACLLMVLGFFGKAVGRDELRDVLGAGRDGSNARDILGAARHFGLRARGVKVELSTLACLPRGTILHWGFSHFVVLDRVDGDALEIVDPAQGRCRVPMREVDQLLTGVALLFEPSESFERSSAAARAGQATFVRHLVGDAGEWSRILATSLFLQLLALALPLLMGLVVDRVVPRGDQHLLLVVGVGLAFIVGFHLLASLVRAHLLLEFRTFFDARMSLGLLEHLVRLPFLFFQRRASGDLLMRLNSSAHVREILTSAVVSAALDGALMVGYLGLLLALDARMGLLVACLGALQVLVFVATRRRRRELGTVLVGKQSAAQSYQVDMLTGIETVRAMGCEGRAQERWTHLFVEVLNASLAEGRLGVVVDSLTATMRMAAPLVVLLVGARMVLAGGTSLGAMLALNAFAVGTLAPLASLVAVGGQVQSLGVYIERIREVQETAPEQDAAAVRPAPSLTGAIELDHVGFRYGPLDPLVVDGVSVRIEPGQFVAIVGKSGSGKSSLAGLLVGLYPPTNGRVCYDGVDLAELDLGSVRRQFGIVTQRAHLFGGTLRSNLALAHPDAKLDDLVEAAKVAQVHDDIVRMPMGYETVVLGGGSSLSGGQRQRVALARALVGRPAILLLDEATSALDAVTERNVQEALGALSCTRIVIAHRLSTIVDADRILVLDQGRLVEQGSHAELMDKRGVYHDLVAAQLAG